LYKNRGNLKKTIEMANQGWARIELLSKDNFDTWKLQVRAVLIKNDV